MKKGFIYTAIVGLMATSTLISFEYAFSPAEKAVYAASTGSTMSAENIMGLINDFRQVEGLERLKTSKDLTNSACLKLEHMVDNQYFEHISPNGVTPWYFFHEAGYKYIGAGENLAKGYTNTTEQMQAWINSPTHYEVMKGDYTEQGVCTKYVTLNGADIWLTVSHFGKI